MDTLTVLLISFYLNVSMDSAKKINSTGWNLPDTNYMFSTAWVEHSAHVLSVKEPTSKIPYYYPLFYGKFQSFALPIVGVKSSGFGKRWGKQHYGVDIAAPTGTDVFPVFHGVVRYARYNNGGYGNLVVIRHYNGLETYYAHLSKINVIPGQRIDPSTIIGLSGSTGHSSGPHLHFEVRILGYPFNPEYLILLKSKIITCFAYAITKEGVKLSNVKNIFCKNPICTNCNYTVTKETISTDSLPVDRSRSSFGNMN